MPLKKLRNHRYIYERISEDGRLTGYQVRIRRKGCAPYTRSFDDLDQADAVAIEILNDRNHGSHRDDLASHRKTLGEVIENAIRTIERDPGRKGRNDDVYRLNAFFRQRYSALPDGHGQYQRRALERLEARPA